MDRHGSLSPLLVPAFALLAACGPRSVDASEGALLVEALGLRPGETVADVGAGDGDWVDTLLDAVGESGHVWATEVEEGDVEGMREDFDADRVTVVLGDQDRTGLAEACCDAILLRLVYHHFERPGVMMADLAGALRPGGRMLLIETRLQEDWEELDGVPDRGGHGVPFGRLLEEVRAEGWAVRSEIDPWNDEDDRYAVVLEPPAPREP